MTAISPSPEQHHPRRPIVAALSLALPGLGQALQWRGEQGALAVSRLCPHRRPRRNHRRALCAGGVDAAVACSVRSADVQRLALRHRRCMALGEEPPDLHAPGMAGQRALRSAIYRRQRDDPLALRQYGAAASGGTLRIPSASMEPQHSKRRLSPRRQALQLPQLRRPRGGGRHRPLRLPERPHGDLHQARDRPARRPCHD